MHNQIAKLIILFLLGGVQAVAQEWALALPKDTLQFEDSLSVLRHLESYLDAKRAEGYLAASLDELTCQERFCKAGIYLGPLYYIDNIILSRQVTDSIDLPLQKYVIKNMAYSQSNLEKIAEQIQHHYYQNGFPLAEARLELAYVDKQGVTLELNLDPGRAIDFGTIEYNLKDKVRPGFLFNFLSIRSGQPFNLNKVEQIPGRIESLSFLSLSDSIQVEFYQGQSHLSLPLSFSSQNAVSALAGFSGTDAGLEIFGELDVELDNLFKLGHGINISYFRQTSNAEYLDFSYLARAILPGLAVQADFQAIREDSSFNRVNWKLSGSKQLKATHFLQLGLEGFQGTEFNPARDDGQFSSWYLSSRWGSTRAYGDWNRKSQFRYSLEAGLGRKSYLGNALPQGLLRSESDYCLEVRGTQWILRVHQRAGVLLGEEILFSENFGVGSDVKLRGRPRNYFYSPYFAVFSLSPTYYPDKSTRFYGIFDLAFLQDQGNPIIPYNFGAGLDFNSSGTLKLQLMLNSFWGDTLNWSNLMLNVSYVSRF